MTRMLYSWHAFFRCLAWASVSVSAGDRIACVWQYLETPQYLRKALFPMHPHLKNVAPRPPSSIFHL